MKNVIPLLILAFLNSCAPWISHSNEKNKNKDDLVYTRASFDIQENRGKDDVLVLLALSGGGSRAAYFSGMVMIELDKLFDNVDLLKEVDMISSVSGGSLPAAYYCLSRDPSSQATVKDFLWPEPDLDQSKVSEVAPQAMFDKETNLFTITGEMTQAQKKGILNLLNDQRNQEKINDLSKISNINRRIWDYDHVNKGMKKNYEKRLLGSMFLPHNILLYWTSPWDRSDILAQVFADNLFDSGAMFDPKLNNDFKFEHLNAERPYLILNATDGTENTSEEHHFGNVFTFTKTEFEEKGSDIREFPISKAVTASAAFPGLFNYVTLRDYSKNNKKNVYVHVFDGGNADNLGIKSLKKAIDENQKKFKNIIVILVDAFVNASGGIDRNKKDGRKGYFLTRIVDMNFLDSLDILLQTKRDEQISLFKEYTQKNGFIFWHINFQELLPPLPKKKNGELTQGTRRYKSYMQYYGGTNKGKQNRIDAELEKEYRKFTSKLDKIPTRFHITKEDTQLIDEAIRLIFQYQREHYAELKLITKTINDAKK